MFREKLAGAGRGLLGLTMTGWLLAWAGVVDAACGDVPAPGVDYSGCVLTDDLDGAIDSALTGLDLRDADLSGAQIHHRLDNVDFRGAVFDGAAFRLSDGSLDNTSVSFENRDTRFYDTQFLLSVREVPPGSSEYRAGMFLKGVGLISPFDGNPFGMRSSGAPSAVATFSNTAAEAPLSGVTVVYR